MNEEVTAFIEGAPAEQKTIMAAIRSLIHETVPGTTEEMKWSRPVFRKGQDFAYLKSTKAYVTLGFFRSDKLEDPNHLLEGTGKDMRHIKIRKTTDLDPTLLKAWFRAATTS